tara:strand:+ start:284 stop:406 length:123 start_codon:yes stop_codon:yes gene_type:complete
MNLAMLTDLISLSHLYSLRTGKQRMLEKIIIPKKISCAGI